MKKKRVYALLLAVVMVFSMMANMAPALAVASDTESGYCPHHTEHVGCSYVEGTAGAPCNHVHDTTCGYQQAKDEVSCNMDCVDVDGDGIIDHSPDCAYQPAVEGHACGHVHDKTCGYVAAVEAVPCDFVCPICDCICTSLCQDGAVNQDCPVCSADYANCTFTTVDVSVTFNADYAEFGKEKGAQLTIAGNISGKKITQAKVSVLLSDEEISMLDISEASNMMLDDNQLIFTMVNDESSGITSVNYNIPVQADNLATFNITKDDIQVSVLPEDYQTSSYIQLNLTGDKLVFVKN